MTQSRQRHLRQRIKKYDSPRQHEQVRLIGKAHQLGQRLGQRCQRQPQNHPHHYNHSGGRAHQPRVVLLTRKPEIRNVHPQPDQDDQ